MKPRRDFLRMGALAGASGLGALEGKSATGLSQDLFVYREGGRFKVRGQIDGRILLTSASAGEAIQQAIGLLGREGGEIRLQRGRFALRKQINLASRIHLRGSGPGTSLWIDEAHDTGIAVSGAGIEDAIVSDLAIKCAKGNARALAGVVLDACGACQVRNLLVLGVRDHGIWLRNNSFLCEIAGCRVGGAGSSAIFLEMLFRAGRGGDYVPNLVTNCIVYAGGAGIECSRAIVANIVGCEAFQTGGPAFHIRNTSNSVLISGCRTFQIQSDAVMVDQSDEINISSNVFCWHVGHGIVLQNVIWGTVTANEVIDTGSVNAAHPAFQLPAGFEHKNGICLLNTKGVSVTGNAIFNWPVAPAMLNGVLEDAASRNNVITSNNINFCKNAAVASQGQDTKVADNAGYLPEPFRARGPKAALQTFDVGLMSKFIDAQRE